MKRVVKPWVAVVYVVVEVIVLALATTVDREADVPVIGLALMLLMITAATHTALLDSEVVTIGRQGVVDFRKR
ncbi:hypothetical protein AB0J21_32990 [Streptomyces sp. NPDC049954]|uniref:hypothetical protein n=1 Tax=Streptomyces sp. NPDC049954 TaxID=3155779 RepID=UPI0034123E62